jgi:hypothetical protein
MRSAASGGVSKARTSKIADLNTGTSRQASQDTAPAATQPDDTGRLAKDFENLAKLWPPSLPLPPIQLALRRIANSTTYRLQCAMVGGLQRVGERTFAETRGNGEVAPKKPSTGRTPVLPLAHWGVASTKNSAEVAAAKPAWPRLIVLAFREPFGDHRLRD